MVCPTCGTENSENARFCGECGTNLKDSSTSGSPSSSSTSQKSSQFGSPQYVPQRYYSSAYPNVEDTASGWAYLCSFCFPIVGLVLFIIWNKEKPNTAKTMGLLALAGVVVSFLSGYFLGI